ncbi:MAG: IS1634 family transposase, partial [Acidimicrobiales bacterium]
MAQLLRRSSREDGKVKDETLANLSHLPPEAVEALRKVLAGKQLVEAGEGFDIERSLPHGHVAAAWAMAHKLGMGR